MSRGPGVFDESWHRVRSCQVRLLPGIQLVRQRYRGQDWYVVRDRMGHRFFRIRPAAYDFLSFLQTEVDVESAWERSLRVNPESSPGQGEAVQLLSQLYQAGLLRSDKASNVQSLAEVHQEERAKERRQQWSSLLFLRIPLWNPDPFLRRTIWLFRGCFTRLGMLLWVITLGWGILTLGKNWGQFQDVARSILGWANLPWLYLSLILTKALHEFGHAYACRRYGGEVPRMGIMLLIFNPLPYMDASSSYAFQEKHRRVIVGVAGMMTELFVAALAIVFWANSGDGIANRVAYNVAITASVSTLLFNLNPLLRFDGYHILCDILETPNLQSRSQRTVVHWLEKYLFRVPPSPMPAETRGEAGLFGAYFLCSWIYRIFLMAGILLFVSKQFLILGVLLSLVFAVMWGLVPLCKWGKYLFTSPKLMNRRLRSILVASALLGGVGSLLFLVPIPYHFRSGGVVRCEVFENVYATSGGTVAQILVSSGTMVEPGMPLVRLENLELLEEQRLLLIEEERTELRIQRERAEQATGVEAVEAYLVALDKRLDDMEWQLESLVVKAKSAGRWIAPDLEEKRGVRVPRGFSLGHVQGEDSYKFSAVISQRDVDRVFAGDSPRGNVRLHGQAGSEIVLSQVDAIPAEQSALPSAALGVLGGGSVGVDSTETSGQRSTEPFFELRGSLDLPEVVKAEHGQRGTARFDLPPKPLGMQWLHRLRQLLQKEYQL